jgi:hypothetical protein
MRLKVWAAASLMSRRFELVRIAAFRTLKGQTRLRFTYSKHWTEISVIRQSMSRLPLDWLEDLEPNGQNNLAIERWVEVTCDV